MFTRCWANRHRAPLMTCPTPCRRISRRVTFEIPLIADTRLLFIVLKKDRILSFHGYCVVNKVTVAFFLFSRYLPLSYFYFYFLSPMARLNKVIDNSISTGRYVQLIICYINKDRYLSITMIIELRIFTSEQNRIFLSLRLAPVNIKKNFD